MRNEDRLKAHQSDEPLATTSSDPTEQQNTLAIPQPTELVDLPSAGKYYQEDHPLYQKSHMEIKYLTAKEEDILTNRSLLKKGLAVEKMLQSIIVDKTIKLDSLLIGDKNALSLAARCVGYGSDYKAKVPCSSCGETFESSFDLDEAREIKDNKSDDVEFTENNTVIITLPRTKAKVECRFLDGVDEKSLVFTQEKKRKNKLPETNLTDQMKLFVVSINGVEDKNQLSQFIGNMPAIDSRWLRTLYRKASPNIDLVYGVECEKCGAQQDVELPFSADFFWPQQ